MNKEVKLVFENQMIMLKGIHDISKDEIKKEIKDQILKIEKILKSEK
jgi:hypothetical protein